MFSGKYNGNVWQRQSAAGGGGRQRREHDDTVFRPLNSFAQLHSILAPIQSWLFDILDIINPR
jgi:hypothetical protein